MLCHAHSPLQAAQGSGHVWSFSGADHAQLAGCLEDVVRLSDVEFEGGSGGEVAGPEAVVGVGVGEEVVGLEGPGEVGAVEGVEVAGGRGVEEVDAAAVGLARVDVLDCFVEVFEPHVGVGVLEVGAHGHD